MVPISSGSGRGASSTTSNAPNWRSWRARWLRPWVVVLFVKTIRPETRASRGCCRLRAAPPAGARRQAAIAGAFGEHTRSSGEEPGTAVAMLTIRRGRTAFRAVERMDQDQHPGPFLARGRAVLVGRRPTRSPPRATCLPTSWSVPSVWNEPVRQVRARGRRLRRPGCRLQARGLQEFVEDGVTARSSRPTSPRPWPGARRAAPRPRARRPSRRDRATCAVAELRLERQKGRLGSPTSTRSFCRLGPPARRRARGASRGQPGSRRPSAWT